VLKLRPLPRLLLTAVLACQLLAGAPAHAQPVAMASGAPAATQPMAAHCAGHAMAQSSEPGAAANHTDSNHPDAAGHDKGCCGDSGCATGHCASHCAGVVALTPFTFAGLHRMPADLAPAFPVEPRVERRSFGFFRPPI